MCLMSCFFACLVLLEVIIDGVLQLAQLLLLLHLLLLLVSGQAGLHVVLLVVVILLFLRTQKGVGGRGRQGRAAEGGVSRAAMGRGRC